MLCFSTNSCDISRRRLFAYIIACRRIFFNPVSAAPAHKSYSALQSPDAPAGSAQRLQLPQAPLAGLCATLQRHGQLCEGELARFSFGYGKGAACWPRLCGRCSVFCSWLDKVCPEVGTMYHQSVFSSHPPKRHSKLSGEMNALPRHM